MKLSTKLKDIVIPLSLCLKCKMCTYGDWPENYELCPPYFKGKFFTYSGGGMIYIARSFLMGVMDYTPEVGKIVYQCTTCGNCDRICELVRIPSPHVGITDIVRVIRNELVSRFGPLEAAHKTVEENIMQTGNPYGEARKSAVQNGSANSASKPEILLFTGCTVNYKRPEILTSTLQVLDAAKVNYRIMTEESCCGSPLYDLGLWDNLEKIIDQNVKKIQKEGIKKIVFLCPHCNSFFQNQYVEKFAQAGTDIQLVPMVEYLEELLSQGRIKPDQKKGFDRKVTYHDPCYLSRHLGNTDSARKVLETVTGTKILEMKRSKTNSYCCGAGGGTLFGNQDLVKYAAKERMDEAAQTRADTVVTSCALCKGSLAHGGQMEVKDLTEVILNCL